MNKLFCRFVVFSLAVFFALTSSSQAYAAKPIVCKMALTVGKEHAYAIAYQRMADLIEKRTNGAIKVEMFYDGQLGSDREVFEALQSGGVQGTMVSTGTLSPFAKKLMVFDLPFLFPNRDVAFKVQESKVGEELLHAIDGSGVTALCFWESGYYWLTNNKINIATVEQLKNIKVRSLEATTHQDTWKALGMLPTVMPFGELFTALQQGVVDAQANTIPNIVTTKVYEIQKNIAEFPIFYHTMMVLFSDNFLNKLTPEQKKIVKDTALEVRDWHKQNNGKIIKENIAMLKKKGNTFTKFSQAELDKAKKICAPVYDKTAKDVGGDLVKRLTAEVGKVSKSE